MANKPSKSLHNFTTGKVSLEFFDPKILELQRELARPEHKEILKVMMAKSDLRDFSDCIKHIASEVDIALDGMYTPQDIIDLCPRIIDRLVKRRGGILVIS